VVSHATAGVLHGIDGVRTRRVEITVSGPRDLRSPRVAVHRSERLDRADRMLLGPIPITTPVRTVIDVAQRLPDDRLLAVMESAFRLGLATPERLAVRLDALRSSGRPGLGRLVTLLERRGCGVLDSDLEARVWLLLSSSDLPLPVRQYSVVAGGERYELDFAWPDRKLGLESDGWGAHSGLGAFQADRARMSELVAAGWRVLTVTWDQVRNDPQRVVRWVRDGLRRAIRDSDG
jgi:very-short-patch-repair endonuclease